MSQTRRLFKTSRELLAVSRLAGRAIVDFSMIDPGDRIAVAVSGGKDSLSLLHVLQHRRQVSPFPFEFTAVHIDFDFSDFDPAVLAAYCREQGFDFRLKKAAGLEEKRREDVDCFRWSRARRQALFHLCGEEGFSTVAFGHHLDDIVETVLLNQFYRGEIGGMKPRQELFGGRVVLIRPLAYVRETRMVELARALGIDGMGQSQCAADATSQRMMIKRLLADLETHNPHVVKNIFHSLQNIKQGYLLDTVTKGNEGDESSDDGHDPAVLV